MAGKYEFSIETKEAFYRYPERYRIAPFRICGNLYYVGNSDVGAHLIDTGEGLILIDTTYPTTRALLIQSIWEMGFDPKDIKCILHTHGHFDHFGATDLVVSLSGAKTYLGAGDAKMFRENPELALIHYGRYAYTETFCPDVELGDGDVIALGDTSIRAVSTPGHSDGVMSYFFEVREDGRSYMAGMHGGAGLNTLCRRFVEQYGNTHSRADFLQGLEKVRNEHVDILLGNHAMQNHTLEKRARMLQSPEAPNPFLNPDEWGIFIDSLKAGFSQMLADERNGTD
jgi:metallo-beta-lactamase class B